MSEYTFMKAVKSTEKIPDKQNNMIKSLSAKKYEDKTTKKIVAPLNEKNNSEMIIME